MLAVMHTSPMRHRDCPIERPPRETGGVSLPARPRAAWLMLIGLMLLGCVGPRSGDPVTMDPAFLDAADPPRMVAATFEVGGAPLNAIVYEAQGKGPHPTALLLHGFPGNERNLDLAQALRRAGWNVVFFHYRGSWGSGGRFSFEHVLEDVAAVVEAVAQPEFARAHRIRPHDFSLVGHSMGGFAALISGAKLERVACVTSMAGGNLGLVAKQASPDPEAMEAMAATLGGWSGPIRGPGGGALVAELLEKADRFDLRAYAPALARKKLLLVVGALDRVAPITQHHTPLVEALEVAGAESLVTEVIDGADHAFSGQRIELARLVTDWHRERCTSAD